MTNRDEDKTMATAARQRQFTGWHMLASLIAFFGVILAVNLTLAYFANSTWSGLVVENGYVASQSFGADLAKAKAQDALGWTVGMSHSGDRVRLTFADTGQQKISGLKIRAKLRRTVSDQFDTDLAFSDTGAGVYSAPANLAPGLWEMEVDAAGDGVADYHKIFRFVVKG
jgi:nitrogen fixation protein FixH